MNKALARSPPLHKPGMVVHPMIPACGGRGRRIRKLKVIFGFLAILSIAWLLDPILVTFVSWVYLLGGAGVLTHTYACMCMWKLDNNLGYHSSWASHLVFWNEVCHWPGTHQLGLSDWPTSPNSPLVSPFAALRLQRLHHLFYRDSRDQTQALMWAWQACYQPSCLSSP